MVTIHLPRTIAYDVRDMVASVRHYARRAGLRPSERIRLEAAITEYLEHSTSLSDARTVASHITSAIVEREPIRIIPS